MSYERRIQALLNAKGGDLTLMLRALIDDRVTELQILKDNYGSTVPHLGGKPKMMKP